MIQRIQSLYLLLVAILLIVTACLPMGAFTNGANVSDFASWGITINGAFQSTIGLLSLLVFSTLVAFATIFLFKNRRLQIRLSIFNSLLLIAFYAVFFVYFLKFKTDINSFQMSFTLGFPIVCVVLNYMAVRAITCDDVMVKAADRLR